MKSVKPYCFGRKKQRHKPKNPVNATFTSKLFDFKVTFDGGLLKNIGQSEK